MHPLFDRPQFEAIVPAPPQMYGTVDNQVYIYPGDTDEYYRRPIAVPTGLFKFMDDVLKIGHEDPVHICLDAQHADGKVQCYALVLMLDDDQYFTLWIYKTLPVWAEK